MVEEEIDEYKLDINQGKKHLALRVSLINNFISFIIKNMSNPREKYCNLIRLEQLKNVCQVFNETKTIMEALSLIKNTIERGNILVSDDEKAGNIEIKFNINLQKKTFPPFVIGLPLDIPKKDKIDSNTLKIKNNSKLLSSKLNYQGDMESITKNGLNPKDNIILKNKINSYKNGISDYSIASEPNKPLVIPNYYGSIPNPTIKGNINTLNNSNNMKNGIKQFIQDSQKFLNEIQNRKINISSNILQNGLNKSLSTPSIATLDKMNHDNYQNNFSQNPNLTLLQNGNLKYLEQNKILQNNQANNNISKSMNINGQHNHILLKNGNLARNNSSQGSLVSQAKKSKIVQKKKQLSQKKFQEQKKMQLMQQKQKMSQQQNPKKNQIPIPQNNKPINNQLNQQGSKQQSSISQSQNLKNMQSQQKEIKQELKQSYSQQQILKQKPPANSEITEQQIALAQMASLQNLQNPNNVNISAAKLNQKFLDPEGNEETQSNFEREEQIQLKQQKEQENQEEIEYEEEEINESNEAAVFENLYRTEEGLIIFRNGLLRGIIHKFAEITDVVSKIQIMMLAGVNFFLIYRASEHGDSAKKFHEKCDNHEMTLILVETTKGVRFGGFTTKTWDGNCVKKIDNNAFVFSIDKNKIYDVHNNDFAIGAYPKFGPVFFGCQIRIYDEFFKKGGTTCHRGLNYNTKIDYELNNGEQSFIVKEIEVYDVEVMRMETI